MAMYKIYDSTETVVAYVDTEKDAYDFLSSYLDEIGFTSYYLRTILLEDRRTMIDYGSHTHFFYLDWASAELEIGE